MLELEDVLRCLLGKDPRGVLIGRAFVYGLGAMGQAGVTRALQVLANELELTMAFCGHTDLHQVDQKILLPGTYDTAGGRVLEPMRAA